jgi:hypothetical protein
VRVLKVPLLGKNMGNTQFCQDEDEKKAEQKSKALPNRFE